ncbi:isoleucyl-tRNA synthetase [Candidatus Planktophila sulfonica]|uniref:Isoleucine--tRNA ligase n=1 Tax=Candidatus Planktophila sulfonica TaxID=1884904 RepID=A0A249KGL0_9ACTN|nr:isoleucine--tRNA ligase [Candidatus Planktophila sulfonica]ASY15839.1 isoleucyl-tRNA synthetase [Candidatus Planktophila sulfonica]
MSSPFRAIPAAIDLPAMEHSILDFWRENEIFQKSMQSRANGTPWTFYEGPPTANGMPGTHHIEARVFKDVFPRYQTMKGKYVTRKAGWDCHGLPVEIAVEKELGFSGKGDIEKFGIAPFNDKCRESVTRHVDAFTTMTERMGFWVDFDQAYWTMAPEYVESVWWSLKEIWKKGLLVQDHRVAPYCPRCGTGLSDHELSQGYETVTDPSVFVRFPATSGELAELGASFLVWTTTPWTLVSNTAVAVHPDVDYVVVKATVEEVSEILVVAQPLLSKVAGDHEILKTIKGKDLERTTYKRPFDYLEIPDSHFIVLATYVTTEDGTGLVHQSPAFGADDLQVCRAYGLPVVNPIAPDGTFLSDVPVVGGMFFKEADKPLVKELKASGVLYKHQPYEHEYPHCWRCHTALIYYAQPSWYIRTTSIKDELIRENQKTDWHPETIKTGRYGDWLTNNIDWALSRNRYWGTPLPIWRCENKHEVCVDSLKELGALSGQELSAMDPHRPFVDDITFACAECSATMNRVPEVIDCWYDSGAMPFAQWGYPHKEGSVEKFKAAYPADFICEAIDQTRGWFYTLMAIGTLVFDESSYKSVLCLGHILDKDGRKMSKHLGNVLEPISLMDQHGADAVRWYMLAAGSPWSARRVGHDAISDVVRKTLLTYWNTISFHALYAEASKFELSQSPALSERSMMDQWIISELNALIVEVDTAYNDFDSQTAGRVLARFIDDLSNWYVRRSRRRFWDGDVAALATLHETLTTVTQLLAPMVPFIAEHTWQVLVRPADSSVVASVHLTDFPVADSSLINAALNEQVAMTRRVVELGRSARAESAIKIRQPLQRALISAQGWASLPDDMKAQISDELNVIELEDIANADGDLVDISVKANFKSLGAKYGKAVQDVAKLVAAADATALVKGLRSTGAATLGEFAIDIDDLVVTEVPKSGWMVASHDGESVALDLALSPELIASGNVREVIRLIQERRKSDGFDISDRISVRWSAPAELAEVIAAHTAHISDEVLALSFEFDAAVTAGDNELSVGVTLAIA